MIEHVKVTPEQASDLNTLSTSYLEYECRIMSNTNYGI